MTRLKTLTLYAVSIGGQDQELRVVVLQPNPGLLEQQLPHNLEAAAELASWLRDYLTPATLTALKANL